MSATLEYRILGPLEAWAGGRSLVLGGARQRGLLALLLTRANEVVSSDRLIDDLWNGRPPETAANAVQGYVYQLRKVLGHDAIVTRPPGYVAQVEREGLDLYRFERLLEEGGRALEACDAARAATLLRDALALWRGPALADFEFEPFAQPEIARLEELRLAAVERRIDADLRLGRQLELAGELEALVARHPLRERFRGQLMLALYGAGRQAEALAAYRATREALVEGLGIEPSPWLAELERAILVHDPALSARGGRAGAEAPRPAGAEAQLPADAEAPRPADATAPHPSDATAPHPSDATAPHPSDATAPHPSGAEAPRPAGATAPQPAGAETPQPAGAAAPPPAGAEASPPADVEGVILVAPRDASATSALLELAERLARRPPRELILARLLADQEQLGEAAHDLERQRRALVSRGVPTRVAAFTSQAPGEDLVMLGAEQEADLLLLDAPPSLLDSGVPEHDLALVLSDMPCDVALLAAGEGEVRPGPDRAVLVPFGGADHEWAAAEIGAWIARTHGAELKLLGTEADPELGRRDASRLLARAALMIQRVAAVPTEPELVARGTGGILRAAGSAGVVVVGLSDRWREEGLGSSRLAVLRESPVPALLVRRGLRPGGIAPRETLTRFTWTASQG